MNLKVEKVRRRRQTVHSKTKDQIVIEKKNNQVLTNLRERAKRKVSQKAQIKVDQKVQRKVHQRVHQKVRTKVHQKVQRKNQKTEIKAKMMMNKKRELKNRKVSKVEWSDKVNNNNLIIVIETVNCTNNTFTSSQVWQMYVYIFSQFLLKYIQEKILAIKMLSSSYIRVCLY